MKKYTRLNIIAMLLIVLSIGNVKAQETMPVNMEAVLKLAGANNLTIKKYEIKYQQALADQSKAKEWWLPNIYAGTATHYLNGAAMNTDGKIFTNVNRNNLWAGLGIAAEIDFSKGVYQTLAAKQKAVAANYFNKAEKNKAILQAIETYYDLQVAQLNYLFLQRMTNQSDTLSQQLKIKMEAGLLYQSEYLLSQSNFQHIKITMLQAKVDWQKKSALLINLLNLANTIKLVSADTSLMPLPFSAPSVAEKGFEKRPEYLGMNAALKSYETQRKTVNQGLLLPKLKVGFDNGSFGAYNATLYNTYQLNASLLWTLPLGRLTYKGDVKRYDAQINLQQNEIAQFENQYEQEISVATAQLQITAAQMSIGKQALQSSTEAMSQSIERQKLGTAKAFEVFQSQQFLLQAQLDYLKAVSEYNKAQFDLKVAMGDNL